MIRIFTFFLLLFSNYAFSDCVDPGTFSPPANPTQAPPFHDTVHLPVVFVNNSGLSDQDVYIVIVWSGTQNDYNYQGFVQFDSSGVGTLQEVWKQSTKSDAPPPEYDSNANGSDYAKSIADFPGASPDDGVVSYLPYINSAAIYFSYNNKLDIPVVEAGLKQPGFTDPTDPNYNTVYQTFEFVFLPTPTQISANATAVSYFGIPIYAYISTPDVNTLPNTGLYQPRDYIFNQVKNCFQTTPFLNGNNDWPNLILENSGSPLRIVSTQNGMAAFPPLFDINYLDNSSRYGYSYLEDIWYGTSSYFKSDALSLTTPTVALVDTDGNPTGQTANYTYTGTVDGSNEFVFTRNDDASQKVVLLAPTTSGTNPTDYTSFNIFSGNFSYMIDSDNTTANDYDQPTQVTKLFQEAIIAGIIPTPPPDNISDNTEVPTKLSTLQSSFYQNNPNLNAGGTKPWYDLYSKALHAFGNIYTYAFDEPLWPQVQISSQYFNANETFMQLWIGPNSSGVETTTSLTINPTSVLSGNSSTFTATVAASGSSSAPTGTVQFYVNGSTVGPAQNLDSNGTASYVFDTTGYDAPSYNEVQAIYTPSSTDFLTSNSNTATLEITTLTPKTQTTTTLISNPLSPSSVGQQVTFTATVAAADSSSGVPTGSVIFTYYNTQTQELTFGGPSNLNGSGKASVNQTFTDAGTYNVRALYIPAMASNFAASASQPYPFVVNEVVSKYPTVTTLVSSSPQSEAGVNVTFDVTVMPQSSAVTDKVTGKVTLISVGQSVSIVGTQYLDANGQTSFTTSFEEGDYNVYAVYQGNSEFYPSFSSLVQHVVGNELPPTYPWGEQKKNKYATQTEYVNKIVWKGPIAGDIPVSYKLYRNVALTDLVTTVPGSNSRNAIFNYFDRLRMKGVIYSYYIVSVFSGGGTSSPVEVTVYPVDH